MKPYVNKHTSEISFSQLQNKISEYQRCSEVPLCGDFNAQTGRLTDYTQMAISVEPLLIAPSGRTMYMFQAVNFLEINYNSHGELLCNIYESNHLRILN
jgi:hypothetical protein